MEFAGGDVPLALVGDWGEWERLETLPRVSGTAKSRLTSLALPGSNASHREQVGDLPVALLAHDVMPGR